MNRGEEKETDPSNTLIQILKYNIEEKDTFFSRISKIIPSEPNTFVKKVKNTGDLDKKIYPNVKNVLSIDFKLFSAFFLNKI